MIYITSEIYVLLVISIVLLASQSNALTLCLLKSYMTQLIYSPWFTFTATYCIYKNLMLYQTNLEYVVYITIQFDFMVPNEIMPGSIIVPTPATSTSTSTTDLIKSRSACNRPVEKNLNMVKVTTTTKSEKIPIVNQQQQRIESEPITAEWIVVTEKKKNTTIAASAVAADARPITTNEKRKPKTRQKKKNNNNKQNKVTLLTNKVSTSSVQTIPTVTVSSPGQQQQQQQQQQISSWSSIVKQQQQQQQQQQEEEDLPLLSDTESCSTTSIESPSLSYNELPVIVQTEKYYSPFSTGFDFGSLLVRSNNNNNNNNNQEMKQQNYTQQHKTSILNLLNQTDQVETTITPTCFKYFDDMMMSTSLYPTTKKEDHILHSIFNSNKRVWDAAAIHH